MATKKITTSAVLESIPSEDKKTDVLKGLSSIAFMLEYLAENAPVHEALDNMTANSLAALLRHFIEDVERYF